MTNRSANSRTLAILVALMLPLVGCSTVDLQSQTAQSAQQALTLAAGQGDQEEAQKYLLRTADRFQNQGDHEAARQILRSDQLAAPLDTLKDQYLLLSMAGASALDDDLWARRLAETIAPGQFRNYDRNLLTRAADLQAETYGLAGRPLDAAQTLMLLREAHSEADVQQIHDRIWQILKRASTRQLAEDGQRVVGYEAQGWVELASVVREPGISLDAQGRTVREWQSNWPDHPAVANMPSELQLIVSIARSRPEKISLALPLSGPLANAGTAVRDGFLAAFYQDETADNFDIDIKVVDTADTSFDELYRELIANSPDLVVGPLEKESLAELQTMSALPVPVLALNYVSEGSHVPTGLYQFGLSAEDEARQIADRLAAENTRQVLALIPQGDWGDRLERALMERMESHSTIVLDIERYFREDNLRAVTADLLGISASRQRAVEAERTAGIDVEFEPRRRQDVDAIVMVAQPAVARQFKPLFAFYFAGDLPVYSPSIIFEGDIDPSRDRDLDQVIFTDLPWFLAQDNEFRKVSTAAFPGIKGQLGRLFAMGADAYRLSTRLPLLQQVEGSSVDGQTGKLTMSPQGSVHREQLWARFVNGTPERLPDTATAEEPEQANRLRH